MLHKYIAASMAAAVAALMGYLALNQWAWNSTLPEGLIQANGRIEGDHVTVASKFPGCVQELLAREGDRVKAGQVLVRLDDVQTRARVEQADAQRNKAQASVERAMPSFSRSAA